MTSNQKSSSLDRYKKQQSDYSLSSFNCKLTKKKLFGQSSRYFYQFAETIIINKDQNKKKADRVLIIKDIKRIIWKYGDEKDKKTYKVLRKYLRGFTIDYQKQSFNYYGDEDVLITLKKQMSGFLFQSRVQDEYEANCVIGEGNYAMVLELKHLHSESIYAAKCIEKKKLDKVENGLTSILNEIKIMRALSPHSLVVNLHEVYEGDNNIYIIMDIAKGGSLYSEMRKRSTLYNKREIVQIMRCLLSALAYIHSKGIMHRDLKPENILFQIQDDLNSLKLADFGLAAFLLEYPYLYPKCGTPGFVAPEVANLINKQERYEVKCDIFSAGVIFHILSIGESLFSGKGHLELLKQNKLCETNPKHAKYDRLDVSQKDLLFKMLEQDPQVRSSAQECLDHAYFQVEDPQQDDNMTEVSTQERIYQKNLSNEEEKKEASIESTDLHQRMSLVMRPSLKYSKNNDQGQFSFDQGGQKEKSDDIIQNQIQEQFQQS